MTKEFVDTVLDSFEEGDIILCRMRSMNWIISLTVHTKKHMMII